MGSRDFERDSGQSISSATTYLAGLGTAFTLVMLCTVESQPGGAQVGMGVGDGAAAVTALIAINDASGYAFELIGGGVTIGAGTPIVPPLGVPLVLAVSKTAGTTSPTFLQYDYSTATATVNVASGTIANRTASAATFAIGNLAGTGAAWDGHIGAVAVYNRALSEGELRSLAHGRMAWLSLFGRGVLTNNSEVFIDLTQPGTIRDLFNPSIAYTGGTQPAFGPMSIRWPGW